MMGFPKLLENVFFMEGIFLVFHHLDYTGDS